MALRLHTANFTKIGLNYKAALVGKYIERRDNNLLEAQIAIKVNKDPQVVRHFLSAARRAHHHYLRTVRMLP